MARDRALARISHQPSAAAAQWRALAGVRSVRMLDVVRMPSVASALRARLRRFIIALGDFVSTTPARSSVATSPPGADLKSRQASPQGAGQTVRSNASHTAPLNRLATNAGEICGLALCLMLAAAALAPAGFAQAPQSAAVGLKGTARTPALDELVPRLPSAADKRDSEALLALAILTLQGRNNADLGRAVTSLEAAAGDGSAEAALALGNAYFKGRAVTADLAAAMNWWRKAAELGAPDAQYNLGLLLLQRGQNTAEALEWLDRAAEADHVLACFAAGTWYAAREQQAARAERHLNCAARQGYAPAQYNLARWHLEKQRTELARTWFEAASVTFEPASRALESLPVRASTPAVSTAK